MTPHLMGGMFVAAALRTLVRARPAIAPRRPLFRLIARVAG